MKNRMKNILTGIFTLFGGIGMGFFLRNRLPDYLFFRVPFALLDYKKAGWLVFLENLLILSFWAFIGNGIAVIFRNSALKTEPKEDQIR